MIKHNIRAGASPAPALVPVISGCYNRGFSVSPPAQ